MLTRSAARFGALEKDKELKCLRRSSRVRKSVIKFPGDAQRVTVAVARKKKRRAPAKKAKVLTAITSILQQQQLDHHENMEEPKPTIETKKKSKRVEVEPNWMKPDYSDQQWFENNCRHCKICNKVFTCRREALSCFFTMHHHSHRQCFICFSLIKPGVKVNKRLFQHYDIRHHQNNDQPGTLECVYCNQIIAYDLVASHIIAKHYYLPYPYEAHPLISPSADFFLRQFNFLDDSWKYYLASGVITANRLAPTSEEFVNIRNYVNNSQAHENFGLQLLQVIMVSRKVEREREPYCPQLDNRMMLWHGTRAQNVSNILKSGLMIPAPVSQMFGQGIYFADRVSKSALYCWRHLGNPPSNWDGYLFLCEVQLGRSYTATAVERSRTNVPMPIIDEKGKCRF